MAGVTMEKMKPVLVLSVILALLLILLLVTGGAEKEETRITDSLVRIAPDEISVLSIKAGNQPELLFSKNEDGWILEKPIFSRASAEAMKSVIESMDKLVGIPLEIDGSVPLSDFGLEGDQVITVTAVSQDGKEEIFSLGRQIPLDVGYVYTYLPSGNRFYKTYKDAREIFNLPIEEYREKTIVDIPINSIEEIELSGIRTEGTSPVVILKQPPWWELTAPAETPGNNAKVRKLLEGIHSLQAHDFPASDKKAFQSDPELQVKLRTSDGSVQTVSFFGGYGNDLQYVTTNRIPYMLGIPSGIVAELPVSFDDLRSRAVLRFDPKTVEEIHIKSAREDIRLKKTESSWRIAAEEELPADEAAINHLISLLTMTDVDDLPRDMNIQNETPPDLRVTITEENKIQHTVELGKALTGGIVPGFSSFRERPFIVPADFFEHLQIDRDYFEDKHLLSFESRNVGSVEIRGKNESFTLEKSGSDWLLTEPERAARLILRNPGKLYLLWKNSAIQKKHPPKPCRKKALIRKIRITAFKLRIRRGKNLAISIYGSINLTAKSLHHLTREKVCT